MAKSGNNVSKKKIIDMNDEDKTRKVTENFSKVSPKQA